VAAAAPLQAAGGGVVVGVPAAVGVPPVSGSMG
jgi:hypothetical protein